MNTRNAILGALMLMVFFMALRAIFLREEPSYRPYISLIQLERYECTEDNQILLTYQVEVFVPHGFVYERTTSALENVRQEHDTEDILTGFSGSDMSQALDENSRYWIEQSVHPPDMENREDGDYLYVEFDCTNVLVGEPARIRLLDMPENK